MLYGVHLKYKHLKEIVYAFIITKEIMYACILMKVTKVS